MHSVQPGFFFNSRESFCIQIINDPYFKIVPLMQNLLQAALNLAQISEILECTAGRPALPLLGDPLWAERRNNPLVQHWLKPLTARALAQAEQPLPALTDALYRDFSDNGTRLPFETVYFERRRRLGQTALALLVGDHTIRDKLLPSFLNKLTDVLDESSWALPAHIWDQPCGKDPMMIDLFAAETANNFAEMLSVLHEVIPAKLAKRIRDRLHTQIFENYADRAPAFGWTTVSNNWNAVCHQGVLGAALTIEDDHDLVARLLVKAAAGLPQYLVGFGNDGSTSEGPGYWSYGFGWFSELNAQLEHRTAGQLSLFANEPKVNKIARFAPQMTLSQGHLVNFSDGKRTGTLSPSLLTYLGQRLDDSTLREQGVACYQQQSSNAFNLDELRSDFFNLTRLALRAPDASTPLPPTPAQLPDVYFPDYGAIVTRGTDSQGHLWEFAAKAGHNDEHHNHNDCGSWLLNINGTPCCLEIGAPEYIKGYFGAERYTFLAARSLGHSVPFINGHEQSAGRKFAAQVLLADLRHDYVDFRVDLSSGYPAEADCLKLQRRWVLDKNAGTLTITDSYELKQAGPFESILITPPTTTRDAKDAFITMDTARIRIQPGLGTQMTAIETCDYRGHQGTTQTIKRIRFAPHEQAVSGKLTYTLQVV